MTRVISVRGKDRAILAADPDFHYVGRHCGPWPQSVFGNPFRVGMDPIEACRLLERFDLDREVVVVFDGPLTAEDAVELYRSYFLACPRLRESLPFFRGRTLGCWCGSWAPGEPEIPCHAVVLAKLAEGGEP
jgi:hypothetical protein